MNNKWVKTQKVVNFPYKDFDPTAYLASVPQETILRHLQLTKEKQLNEIANINQSDSVDTNIVHSNNHHQQHHHHHHHNHTSKLVDIDEADNASFVVENEETCLHNNEVKAQRRQRLESTSLIKTPIIDGDLRDFHEHKLLKGQDPFDLKYQLYAVVSHSGLLNGGHYISYACNPNGNWYCYNDSSCREVPIENPVIEETNQSANCTPLRRRKNPNTPPKTNNNNNNSSDDISNNKYISNKSYLHSGVNTCTDNNKKTPQNSPLLRRRSSNKDITQNETNSVDLYDSQCSLNNFKCSYSNMKIPKMDTSSAYILFYERSGLDYKPYLPEITNNSLIVPQEVELDENESELRKQCTIQ